jgi:hypothetical protein
MKYNGKLFGQVGQTRKYFDTGRTSYEWDAMEARIEELEREVAFYKKENASLMQRHILQKMEHDRMINSLSTSSNPPRPPIGASVSFDWDGQKRTGVVSTYAQCADGHFEVICGAEFDHEVFVLRTNMISVLPNAPAEPQPDKTT